MELLSQRPMFSSDPSTKGFDLSSGEKWIYPENYPVREYQFSIVESALYHNTLVCLPTGNFHRKCIAHLNLSMNSLSLHCSLNCFQVLEKLL